MGKDKKARVGKLNKKDFKVVKRLYNSGTTETRVGNVLKGSSNTPKKRDTC